MNTNHGTGTVAEPSTCKQLLLPLEIDPFIHNFSTLTVHQNPFLEKVFKIYRNFI